VLYRNQKKPYGEEERKMRRQKLTNRPWSWVDLRGAQCYKGAVENDPLWGEVQGELYLTRSGRWVEHWKSLGGGNSSWIEISMERAARWFERYGYAEEAAACREALERYERRRAKRGPVFEVALEFDRPKELQSD